MRLPAVVVPALLLDLLFCSSAGAHGVYAYASTPVTPPLGWLWVPAAFALAIIVWDLYGLKDVMSFRSFLRQEIALLIGFFAVFFLIGTVLGNCSTAPPPGLGLPHPPLYGIPFISGLTGFAFFNTLGIALFLLMKRLFLVPAQAFDARVRKSIIRGNGIIYLLACAPYLFGNAMWHGAMGSYVGTECGRRLRSYGLAFAQYAENNSRNLPEARTSEDLLETLRPYLAQNQYWQKEDIFCPAERASQRNPRLYQWNAAFSGRSLNESDITDEPDPILLCPFVGDEHSRSGRRALYLLDLKRFELFVKTQDVEQQPEKKQCAKPE